MFPKLCKIYEYLIDIGTITVDVADICDTNVPYTDFAIG